MWQLSKEKINRKLALKIIFREFKKEIGLMAESKDLKFLLNDPNYNYDIYIFKVYPNIKLNLMELEKNKE